MTVREQMPRGEPNSATDPLLSAKVGEYIIQERIGSGGMGVVYRAIHPLIGKQVAIKVLRAELVSQEQVERLLVEGRAVNAIHHPGIIDIFGFGSLPDGRPYITMELLRGHSLSAYIRKRGRLDVATTVRILGEILAALGAAHRAGVVHRDLKPGNVFMVESRDGSHSVKLVDFGLAKLVQSQEGPTTLEGTILGTPEFMAPEQIRGAPCSPAADLYAVGVIAFQMLTGERPFKGEPFQVMFAHVELSPPAPSSRVQGIPPELDTLVLHLLAKDPALRPGNAEAVRQALERVPLSPTATPEPLPSVMPVPEVETRTLKTEAPRSAFRTRPGLGWMAGTLMLAMLGGGAYLFWPGTTDGAAPAVEAPAKAREEVAHHTDVLAAQPVVDAPPPAMPEPEETKPAPAPESPPPDTSNAQPQTPPEAASLPAEEKKTPVQKPTRESAQVIKPASNSQWTTTPEQWRQLQSLEDMRREIPPGNLGGIDRELERVRSFAPKVSSLDDRNKLQDSLDALQEKLARYVQETKAARKHGVDETPSVQPASEPAGPARTTQGAETYRSNQLKRLDNDEKSLRKQAGSAPHFPTAMTQLNELREQAKRMQTDTERSAFYNAAAAWEVQYLGAKKTP